MFGYEGEERVSCIECGTPWALVRAGKHQPTCACLNYCRCGSEIRAHHQGDPDWPYPGWDNTTGYYCRRGGPCCMLNEDERFPVVADPLVEHLFIHGDEANHSVLTVRRVTHLLVEVKNRAEAAKFTAWLRLRPATGIFRDRVIEVCDPGCRLTQKDIERLKREGVGTFLGTARQRYDEMCKREKEGAGNDGG